MRFIPANRGDRVTISPYSFFFKQIISMATLPYLSVWAKTSGLPDGPRWHPLPYHLLDVAAVAERLLHGDRLLADLSARQGVAPGDLARFVLLLVALHDIGKANVVFQSQVPEFAKRLAAAGFGRCGERPHKRPHGSVTAWMLDARPEPGTVAAVLHAAAPGMLTGKRRAAIIDPIAGHHGRPVKPMGLDGNLGKLNAPFEAAAGALAADLAALFEVAPLPQTFLRGADRDVAAFSWMLAALTPVADWIGSNQNWFPPREPDLDLPAYWERVARPAASRALREAGLVPAPISIPGAERTLPPQTDPTPLQRHLLDCALPGGPSLFVVEDATGAGKTEAALTLAHRLMQAGRADGFHVSLPTTATADAMFARLGPVYRALFEAGAKPNKDALAHSPSLVVAHGRRRADEEPPVAAYCAGWIADDRRKAFLAQAGAGTLDQALLGVLPTKYQTLRLHGLRGKVLIVDEAHAYDPYMQRELEALLELHAMLGGSAILMSATLALPTRQALVAAFQRGLGVETPAVLSARAYPLVTCADARGASETPLTLARRSRRRVAVRRLASVAAGEDVVATLAAQGACVAMVRTTVDAAIGSFERLRARLDDERVALLHSRFLPRDRRLHDDDALARYGKTSTHAARRGRVLVATQVIEQSLDIDFDAMVSDLAPIDLLIQRAGRLQRHDRPDRPLAEPCLHVISPEPRPEADATWLDAELREAKWVYGDVALLWLTAKRLFEAGGIEASTLAHEEACPAHVRRLVDAVYEAASEDLPTQALRACSDERRGVTLAKRTLAELGVLNVHDGYVSEDKSWTDDAKARTRLEEPPRVALRLARMQDRALVPFTGDTWRESELSVTHHLAQTLAPPDEAIRDTASPAWAEADANARLLVLDEAGRAGDFRYDVVLGLLGPGRSA